VNPPIISPATNGAGQPVSPRFRGPGETRPPTMPRCDILGGEKDVFPVATAEQGMEMLRHGMSE
jgi:hypothetical protein